MSLHALPLAAFVGQQEAGLVALTFAVAAFLVLRGRRIRALVGVAALVLCPLLLVADIYATGELAALRRQPVILAGMGLVGAGVVVTLATAFLRWPLAFPLVAVAVLPFRVPLGVGGETANLLAPLYVVVGAGALAYAWRCWRQGDGEFSRPATAVEWALAGFVVLYGLQALYSPDLSQAVHTTVFFLAPFALLAKLLVELRWTTQLVGAVVAIVIGEAIVFSLLAYGQLATHWIYWNPDLIDTNQFAPFFRVNSVFFDPNIFARFLDLALLALVAVALWQVKRAPQLGAVAVAAAVIFGAMVLTYSQSSLGALVVGLAVLAGLRWSARWTLAAAAAVMAAGVAATILWSGSLGIADDRPDSLNAATSGRVSLLGGGATLIGERPVFGFGSGSFSAAFQEQGLGARLSESHTTPVTVGAEQGVIGLIAYVLVLVSALALLLTGIRGPPRPGGSGYRAARAALAAGFTAIAFHSLVYADFFEDPYMWAIIGIGVALKSQAGFARKPLRDTASAGSAFQREPAEIASVRVLGPG